MPICKIVENLHGNFVYNLLKPSANFWANAM